MITGIATEPKLREISMLVIALVIFRVVVMIGKLVMCPDSGLPKVVDML